MTRAQVIEMLYEAGVLPPKHGATENQWRAFERFAELVAVAERRRPWTKDHWTEYEQSIALSSAIDEREACAQLCEMAEYDDSYFGSQYAAAIRARGDK